MPKVTVLPGRAFYHGGNLCKEGSCVEVSQQTCAGLLADGAVELEKPKPAAKPKAGKAKKAEK